MLLKPSQWVLGCQAWSRTLFVSFCILLMEAALGPRLHMTPLCLYPPRYSHACLAPHTHHSQIELFIPHKPTPSWLSPARQMGTTMHIGCLGQHSGLIFEAFSLHTSKSSVPVRAVDTASKTYTKAPASNPAATPVLCCSAGDRAAPPGGIWQCLAGLAQLGRGKRYWHLWVGARGC